MENKNNIFENFSITTALYLIGALVVVIGIILFVIQIWDDVGSIGRIALTLGFGLLMSILGSMLLQQKNKKEYRLGVVFHFIGFTSNIIGVIVVVAEIFDSYKDIDYVIFVTCLALSAFYFILATVHKKVFLTCFALISGIATLYAIPATFSLFAEYDSGILLEFYLYLTTFLGFCCILLANFFVNNFNKPLYYILYFGGMFGFILFGFYLALLAGLSDELSWDFMYTFVVLGGLLTSLYVKSQAVFFASVFFLFSYIFIITDEYFVDSIGWPASLIILGFVLMALGYSSVNIRNKYFKK